MKQRSQRGSTLVELIVVLALMALIFGLVPAALFAPSRGSPAQAAFQRARVEALRTGRRVVAVDSMGRSSLFLPGGRILRNE